MRIAALSVFMCFAVCVALLERANAQQYDIPGAANSVSIIMTPAQPTPKSTVKLTLRSPLLDLSDSRISWRVNGEPLSEGDGLVTVSINVGAAGQSTEVSASVVSGDDNALAETTITPAGLELLWEAEGYVPPFYRGRTLPGVGARITLVAYPTFIRNGVRISEKELLYTWRRGDTILGSLSGRGRSSITLDAPVLFSADVLSVEASTPDGSISARASARLPSPDSPLKLYENHPLFGVLYHKAFGATAFTSETEMTFLAVPYFAAIVNENDPALAYEWVINRSRIEAEKERPSQITINAARSSGVALIELDVSHARNSFFSTNAAWQITFAKDSDGSANDPFRSL